MDILYANITCFIVLEQLGEDLPGKLYSIDELSHESEGRRVVMDSPPLSLIKIGVARDWPDARALWLVRVHNSRLCMLASEPFTVCFCLAIRLSEDGTLAIWVNMEDHVKLVSYRSDACLQEAFKTICINVLKVNFD